MKLDKVFGSDLAESFEGSGDHKIVAVAPKKSQAAEAQATPPVPQHRHDARQLSAPVEPIRMSPGLNPGYDRADFLRDILNEAARALEDFNLLLRETLEAARGLDLK